jgi:hypothetical protein
MPVYPSRETHDMWLFPHGRYGYTPEERIRESRAACPWCHPASTGIILVPMGTAVTTSWLPVQLDPPGQAG